MFKPWDEPISEEELERFRRIKDVQIVFDVGARTSLDYLDVRPTAEYHLFEPNPMFNEWLLDFAKDKPNIHVNPYGLGDIDGNFAYDTETQSFLRGGNKILPITTLDSYVNNMGISKIDFLKIDTEGYDYKVLRGGSKAIKLCRYIQYETWNEPENTWIKDLLKEDFTFEDIGLRNVFCTRI